MTLLFHVNDELVPADRATVNVRDRGFKYGDAAFETMRAYGGTVFEWDAHAARLATTCEVLALAHGYPRDDLRSRIDDTLAANSLEDAYIRLTISRGIQPGTVTPHYDIEPTVIVIVSELPRGGVQGRPVWDAPATTMIAKTRKIPRAAIPSHAKTHNYLNGILARLECRERDADEAIMLDIDGELTEATTSNLFFVTNGTLHTPSLSGPILPGVTRRVVLELAKTAGIVVRKGRYDATTLADADEVFLTNSIAEIWPVIRVDDSTYDRGPITERLMTRFDERVERRHYSDFDG